MTAITSRIEYAAEQPPSFFARWTSRLALFCVLILVADAFLHRVFALSTPIAMNLAMVAFAGAIVVLVMAAVAGLDIWITGRQGAARVVLGTGVALAILAIPLSLWIMSHDWPAIADVSTDTEDPPEFTELAARRPAGSNPSDFDKDRIAEAQQKSYPDLKPLVIPRPAEESFDLVRQALGKLKLHPIVEETPSAAGDGIGSIELVDTTMIFGFKDDVAIRVIGDEAESRVDIRSASQYGRNDYGRNAARVRAILREIVGRLEAAAPSEGRKVSSSGADLKAKMKLLKRPKEVRRPSGSAQHKPDPSRSGARRAREPLE